jgi:putative ABC transport system ATP-binding protein
MTIVKTTSVQKQFEEGRDAVPVLHGIDFNVDRGEIVSLEGPSGSGKTTFLSILGAILTPTAGEVTINGERIDGASESRLASIRKKHLGFVFQQFNLFPSLTALENVEYALNVKGMKGNGARIEAERVIEAVGLSDRKAYLPRDLSGGQKQRVAIARALAGNAPVLLADEPTANLDSVVGSQILEMFRALAKRENRALVIVTHDPKVRSIADRVVSIRDGRIAA